MRIFENGICRDATEEELAALSSGENEEMEQPITEADRLAALEAAFMELAEVVFNG